jgi:16S rRNA processing protein RimM
MSLSRHSGARRSREPGTHEHEIVPAGHKPVFMGSGPGPLGHPGMTELEGSAAAPTNRVCLGVVGAPHGVRGAVRIKSFTEEPAAIAGYGALEDEAGARQFKLQVIGAAKGDGMIVAKLAGIADRDRAETLRGLRLYLPRAALPPPGEDEFYYADLIGLAAVLEDGATVGKIIAVHDFGAGDMLEIAREGSVHGGQPVLVPFTRAAVPVVDLAARRVVIDPPEGLIDPPRRQRVKELQGEMA